MEGQPAPWRFAGLAKLTLEPRSRPVKRLDRSPLTGLGPRLAQPRDPEAHSADPSTRDRTG